MGTILSAFVLLILIAAGNLALAQGSSPCTAITDDKSRLQCYDAAAKSVLKKPVAPKEDPFIAEAKARVRKQLRDPNSAIFQNIKIKTVSGKRGICGDVNAKNALGGMTGFIPFAYNGEHAYIMVFNAGAGNPTDASADILSATLHSTLETHQKWCK